jgi:hypothetical protein
VTPGKPDISGEANALRRYVSARVYGRPAPQYARADRSVLPGSVVWVECSEVDAAGRFDGKHFLRLRREGLPWCDWLGQDTRIADDHPLQAFFELHAADPHDWNILFKEVTRNRQAALRNWRRQGREAIVRIRWEQAREAARAAGEEAEETHLPTPLADKYRMFLPGMRSLKNA